MDALVIFALICSPAEPVTIPAPTPGLWRELKRLNVRHQLWSPEGRYNEDFRSEIIWTRNIWRECRNCPPLSDADALPPADQVQAAVTFWRARERTLEAEAPLHLWQAEDYHAEIVHARRTLAMWCDVYAAQTGEWYCRRKALRKLDGR